MFKRNKVFLQLLGEHISNFYLFFLLNYNYILCSKAQL